MTSATPASPLSDGELRRLDAYWRAANFLSVGQIYLLDNALLREPLVVGHVKPRLLGHWGTTPGLKFIYAHMSRRRLGAAWRFSRAAVLDWLARGSRPEHEE